jgi:hypothetical protein
MITPHPHSDPGRNYYELRRAIGWLGFSLPFVVALGGKLAFGTTLQDTISDYYYTGMRDVFVGLLTAIAVFLYCYIGYDRIDNFFTNLAGLSALGVAFFPTDPENSPWTTVGRIHFGSAAVFFVTLAIISLWLFRKSGRIHPTAIKKKRNTAYLVCGLTILLCMGLILAWKAKQNDDGWKSLGDYKPVFWLESLAIWAFALSWLIKGQAILKDLPGDSAPATTA